MRHVCTTCDQEFDDIPAGAVQLTPGERRINTYRFPDGTIHSLRRVRSLTEGFHRRWHKLPNIGCEFCFPPPLPESVEQKELLQEVVEVLEKLEPEIVVEVKQPDDESETEVDEEPMTGNSRSFPPYLQILNLPTGAPGTLQ